jgi:hypothetical protein
MVEHSDEEYESIPWDALVTDDAHRRRRLVSLAVAAVLVAGAAAGLTRLLPPDSPVAATTSLPAAVTSVVPTSLPRTEADLTGSGQEERLAAAGAAWFVADYFTVDGSEVTSDAVAAKLPAGSDRPTGSEQARSFVESAIPTDVVARGDGRFRVVVVVRALAAPDGASYIRQPARAVEVVVELAGDGLRIVDLPRPVSLPKAVPGERIVVEPTDPPDVVVSTARDQAAQWGIPEAEPMSAGKVSGLWRIVFEVEDEVGLGWPVAIWADDRGNVVPAGTSAG